MTTDNIIDARDVVDGASGPHGAIRVLGDNYYRDAFYRRIQEERYRQVLRIMAERLDEWVTKREIREAYKGTGSSLDNAIHALRDRRIILSKEGAPGVYRLQNKGFALWIRLHATPPEQLQLEGVTRAALLSGESGQ